MIQRIQSIFLALASGSFFSQFGLSFAKRSAQDQGFFQDLLYNIQDNTLLLVFTILGGILSLLAIFLFNNRSLQLKLTYGTVVFAVLLPVLAIVLLMNSGYQLTGDSAMSYSAGLFVPILSIVLLVLAGRYIAKDEKLVRDSDRLR